MDLIYFIAGLIILGFAGEATLRGAVGLAQRLNISPAMIGLTVVGLGTSLPELVVCVEAALDGKPDLAVGNVVGSNIANILLILGLAAAVAPGVGPLLAKYGASADGSPPAPSWEEEVQWR